MSTHPRIESEAAPTTTYSCRYAWIDGAVHSEASIVVQNGRITAISGEPPMGVDHRLDGLVLPGFANAHSHAFHRALRGRTHADGGTFWTWREAMYRIAGVLDPDLYHRLARAVYAEMVLSGITCVGEFHYVHHQPDGTPYQDPNAMGEALRAAAREAGLRLTLLDACYLTAGIGAHGPQPLLPEQRRFSDGSASAWQARASLLREDDSTIIGAAIHSVRAVPRDAMAVVARWTHEQSSAGRGARPLHAHLSEQPAENAACRAAYQSSPTQVLAEAGALGPRSTMVHATHLNPHDIALLGRSGTSVCFCPTTERDLADGIGPARALYEAGSPLAIGSDQHAAIDPLEEIRALEMHERLVSGERGRFEVRDLIEAGTASGHRSLGWFDAGHIAIGERADLVCLDVESVRTAGCSPEQAVLAATNADVRTVVSGGRIVVNEGRHCSIDVAGELGATIREAWQRTRP